jgi:hypothetical protein
MENNSEQSYLSFGDYLSSYLNEATSECFKHCVKDFTKDNHTDQEMKCLNSCFGKFFLSYANMGDLLEIKNIPK